MFQMPTSTLSMFSSSSKSLGGFFGLICVGIQMVLTVILSDSSKTEFTTAARATTTVKVVLQPTKCVLSNGTTSFPYVAAMGYATIVFLSLLYILRAKGFGTGDQPPSPPSDADTESNAKKRPNRWLRLLLILLVSMVLLSLGAGIFVAYLVPSLHALHPLQSFGADTVRIVERKLLEAASNLSALATHVSLHGRQYTKIILLAIASHCICVLFGLTFRRFCALIVSWAPTGWFPSLSMAIPYAMMTFLPGLDWIFWVHYHIICDGTRWNQIDVEAVLACIERAVEPHVLEISIFLGIAIIHFVAVCIWTTVATLSVIPSTTRVLVFCFSDPETSIMLAGHTIWGIAFWLWPASTLAMDILRKLEAPTLGCHLVSHR
ncbi:hypothetical protein B0H16DRAFT_1830628 [Mycena metata]|uniref:Uncharacterized protein n=1 Tax=Mycena metata TaxID=1033252 RepID=A0AAD7J1J0_9AGAR|nr:hypothetical protein B0H16DRAFT_1830628 [Mycena metata]